MVRDRREVARQQGIDVGEPGRRPRPALHRAFDTARPQRARRQAPKGRPQLRDLPAGPLEPEGGDHGRDILVEAFANLVGRKILARGEQGNADRGDDLARRECALAIAGDE